LLLSVRSRPGDKVGKYVAKLDLWPLSHVRVQILHLAEKSSEIPPLDEVLDMNDWDPRMKEWYDNCNSLRILVVGRSGVGKSTFLNAMFGGEDLAPVAQGRDPTTKVLPANGPWSHAQLLRFAGAARR